MQWFNLVLLLAALSFLLWDCRINRKMVVLETKLLDLLKKREAEENKVDWWK